VYRQRLKTPLQRFEEKFARGDGCWEWFGAHGRLGYGHFYFQGKNRRAHAVSKHFYDGFPIDANSKDRGLQWDHLCRNPKCVRPDHLELVTARVNGLRGVGPHAKNARKTHCPAGHDLNLNGIPWDKKTLGIRRCQVCRNEKRKKLYHANNTKKSRIKLSPALAEEIRKIGRSVSERKMAARYGVSRSTINLILRGINWKTKTS